MHSIAKASYTLNGDVSELIAKLKAATPKGFEEASRRAREEFMFDMGVNHPYYSALHFKIQSTASAKHFSSKKPQVLHYVPKRDWYAKQGCLVWYKPLPTPENELQQFVAMIFGVEEESRESKDDHGIQVNTAFINKGVTISVNDTHDFNIYAELKEMEDAFNSIVNSYKPRIVEEKCYVVHKVRSHLSHLTDYGAGVDLKDGFMKEYHLMLGDYTYKRPPQTCFTLSGGIEIGFINPAFKKHIDKIDKMAGLVEKYFQTFESIPGKTGTRAMTDKEMQTIPSHLRNVRMKVAYFIADKHDIHVSFAYPVGLPLESMAAGYFNFPVHMCVKNHADSLKKLHGFIHMYLGIFTINTGVEIGKWDIIKNQNLETVCDIALTTVGETYMFQHTAPRSHLSCVFNLLNIDDPTINRDEIMSFVRSTITTNPSKE